MSPRTIRPDNELLAYSEEHLLYELHMLHWVTETISKTGKGFLLSALLESFAIHLRNLIDFIYTSPGDARDDDAIAADFYDPPSGWKPAAMSAALDAAKVRANKEVSHLTYTRKSGMAPDKPWAVGALFKEVQDVARRFAVGASPTKLHPKVVEWLNASLVQIAVLSASASTATTNTAVGVLSSSSTPVGGRTK